MDGPIRRPEMRVGVPREIKNHEYRVGLTPPSAAELIAAGHEVVVEAGAGSGIDFTDADYRQAGATIVASAASIFARADLIVKVKEPQPDEIALLEPRHILFTYLHLAADKPQAEGLMASGATCIAYETVTSPNRSLPLLKPMSEVAGRMSIQVGAHYLEKEQGGRGILLGGVPGVAPARVAILGGGVAGLNAAQMAVGQRADVTIYDISNERSASAPTSPSMTSAMTGSRSWTPISAAGSAPPTRARRRSRRALQRRIW
jgi:alanine dehydrogenase